MIMSILRNAFFRSHQRGVQGATGAHSRSHPAR